MPCDQVKFILSADQHSDGILTSSFGRDVESVAFAVLLFLAGGIILFISCFFVTKCLQCYKARQRRYVTLEYNFSQTIRISDSDAKLSAKTMTMRTTTVQMRTRWSVTSMKRNHKRPSQTPTQILSKCNIESELHLFPDVYNFLFLFFYKSFWKVFIEKMKPDRKTSKEWEGLRKKNMTTEKNKIEKWRSSYFTTLMSKIREDFSADESHSYSIEKKQWKKGWVNQSLEEAIVNVQSGNRFWVDVLSQT